LNLIEKEMKKFKYIITSMVMAGVVISSSCKKELDVKNPNQPTLEQAKTESGLTSLAAGSIFINGFVNGDGWLGDSFFAL
jgi:hypothetical protein